MDFNLSMSHVASHMKLPPTTLTTVTGCLWVSSLLWTVNCNTCRYLDFFIVTDFGHKKYKYWLVDQYKSLWNHGWAAVKNRHQIYPPWCGRPSSVLLLDICFHRFTRRTCEKQEVYQRSKTMKKDILKTNRAQKNIYLWIKAGTCCKNWLFTLSTISANLHSFPCHTI